MKRPNFVCRNGMYGFRYSLMSGVTTVCFNLEGQVFVWRDGVSIDNNDLESFNRVSRFIVDATRRWEALKFIYHPYPKPVAPTLESAFNEAEDRWERERKAANAPDSET